ncbi:hypothetical protein FB451DRAFT_1258682 [Mycena latifolia]|nr:hypothetical protein FB451DRAFT_1258682 [Mycena latifolia]
MSSPKVGHILSPKSLDLGRDTFFFTSLPVKARLILGVNQKFTPVTSATIHRWVDLIVDDEDESEEFFLCPVTMKSAGIMSYDVERSGPVIEPYSTEPLPPGNYGWYFNRECTGKGFSVLSNVREGFYTLNALSEEIDEPHERDFVANALPPAAEASIAVARDESRCRFTGSAENATLAWIIPPAIAQYTERSMQIEWDRLSYQVAANVITMQSRLRFHFHNNHFTVDVDDDYRILVLRAMGDEQELLPTHLPRHAKQDAAADHFLRRHCRYSLNLMLRGGDIRDVYSNGAILTMMHDLGVDYIGSGDSEPTEMAPLDDERWQTELGKAILENVLHGRTIQRLDEARQSDFDDEQQPGSGSDEELESGSASGSDEEWVSSEPDASASVSNFSDEPEEAAQSWVNWGWIAHSQGASW